MSAEDTHNAQSADAVIYREATEADFQAVEAMYAKLDSLLRQYTYTFPEVVGHVLEPGGFVSTLAGSASALVIRASGREVT